MSTDKNISIINKTKGRLPSLPFADMQNKILGKNYDLSISFVGSTDSQRINFLYRKKNYPTNVLSFSLSKNSGELVLCPKKVRLDAKNFEMDYENFTSFLLIHGMLHLKGFDHGSTMEKQEAKYKKLFNVTTKI